MEDQEVELGGALITGAECQAAKEAAWLTSLLEDVSIDLQMLKIILGDNRAVLTFAQTTHTPIIPLGTCKQMKEDFK